MADDSFCLQAGAASARFFARGAECRMWRIGSRDMLWPGDLAIWPAVAPLLFPTCGWSSDGAVRVAGDTFPMPVHGFAAQSLFRAEQTGADEIRFSLSDDAQTRRHYPFAFGLTVTYRLKPSALHVEIVVENRSLGPMPYACGLHPGFVWRPADGAHRFVFAEPERPEVPVIAPGGLFSDRHRPVPLDGRALPLSPDLFTAEALCFVDARSRRFAFQAPDGALEIEAPDFPHLILWSSGAAPFLAIESWTGTGDPEGFSGDLFQRPSMIHLRPGESRAHRVAYRWRGDLGTGASTP